MLAFFINFIVVCCSISIPLLVSQIVDFMEKPSGQDGGIWVGIGLISAFVIIGAFSNMLEQSASFIQARMGDKAYAALVTLVYNKTLKVSPATNKNFEQGQIINFVQVDSEKV